MHAGKLRSSPIIAITALKQNGTFLTALAMMVQQLPQFHKLNKGRRREKKAPIKNRAINFLFPFFFGRRPFAKLSLFCHAQKRRKEKEQPRSSCRRSRFPKQFLHSSLPLLSRTNKVCAEKSCSSFAPFPLSMSNRIRFSVALSLSPHTRKKKKNPSSDR